MRLGPIGLVLAVLTVACGGGGAAVDAGAEPCLLPSALGSLGALSGKSSRVVTPEGGERLSFESVVEVGGKPTLILLQLYKYVSVFGAGFAPGTYTIAGPETDYSTCGACVRLIEDYRSDTARGRDYFAQEGTVVLDSIDTRLTGSFAQIRFDEVTIDAYDFRSPRVENGCTTTLAAASFDALIEEN